VDEVQPRRNESNSSIWAVAKDFVSLQRVLFSLRCGVEAAILSYWIHIGNLGTVSISNSSSRKVAPVSEALSYKRIER
jgi:hypothetical protein